MPSSSARERASMFFLLYVQLGADRSLDRLAAMLGNGGIRVSLSTLKRYSTEHGWQQRLLTAEAQSAAQRHTRAVESITAQAERHAQLGRVFQRLAASAADARLRDAAGLSKSSLSAIARAGLAGAEMERRAVGEQHDREGAAVEVWNRLTVELIPAFLELNAVPDEEARVERFVDALDRAVDLHIRDIAEGNDR